MKKRWCFILVIVTLIVNMGFVSYANDDETERTIEYINLIRQAMNLPLVQTDTKLKSAATTHNKYMYYNNAFSSIEESGNLYFRGRYPWDRTSYYLYTKPNIYELISNTNKTYTEGINAFLNNPYSRVALLDPVYTDVGMNVFEGYYTYDLGGDKRLQDYQIVYPYNQQTMVPINWTNQYSISPYDPFKLSPEGCGIPITYTYYSDNLKVKQFKNIEVTLIHKLVNKEIKCEILTPDSDRYLKSSIIILPTEKYTYSTTYELKINMDIEFSNGTTQKVDYTGTFMTQASDTVTINSQTFLNRSKFTEEIVKSLGYDLVEPFEVKFHDIDIKSVNAKYIYTAYLHGIISGFTDEKLGLEFRPDLNISREQAYAMLIRAYESKFGKIFVDKTLSISDYKDISKWAVDEGVIEDANQLGILVVTDNKLKPKEYLTINEFDQIMKKYNEAIANLNRQ